MMSLSKKFMPMLLFTSLLAACGGGGGDGGTGGTGSTNNSGSSGVLTASILGPGTVNTQTGFLNTLNGILSSDPQGLPLTYSWTFVSLPAGSTTRIDCADQPKAEFEPDVAGTYVVQLVVSNGTTTSQPATETFVATGPTTGWTRMGAVLDINYGQDATNPYLATDAAGKPVVAWEETDPNTANMKNIYVKRWNGSSWTQLGGALDTKIADDVFQPVVAIDPTDNNPVVIWEEQDGASKVFVKKWNGSAWVQLGTALNQDITKNAYTRPSIVVSPNGTIYAAWEEYTPNIPFINDTTDIIVAQWTGTTWAQLGANLSADYMNQDPALAIDPVSGYPVLAWSEGSTLSSIYVGHMACVKWNGSTWTGMGQTEFDGTFSADHTAIAIGADGLPLVAWTDEVPWNSNVSVTKYNGSTGFFGGGYMTPFPAGNARSPSLLADPADNQPVLGFVAGGIYVKKWNAAGSAWTQYGSAVNYWSSIGDPVIAFGLSGKIIVAWHEKTNNNNVYVKIQQ